MEVTCPNCESRFNLADSAVKANAKLRCSVCKNVFSIEASLANGKEGLNTDLDDMSTDLDKSNGIDINDLDSPGEPKSKKGKVFSLIFMLLLLGAIGVGGWWYYTKILTTTDVVEDSKAQDKSVELMTMRNVRQYYVQNEKVGSIFVIEGIVVNEFPVAKDLIEVEAAVYAKDKSTLMAKRQLCGAVLSLFQLQVLGEEELEAFLSNQIEILTKNTDVAPMGEVPFMVLFYNPSPEVAEFGVKIVSAKDTVKE